MSYLASDGTPDGINVPSGPGLANYKQARVSQRITAGYVICCNACPCCRLPVWTREDVDPN